MGALLRLRSRTFGNSSGLSGPLQKLHVGLRARLRPSWREILCCSGARESSRATRPRTTASRYSRLRARRPPQQRRLRLAATLRRGRRHRSHPAWAATRPRLLQRTPSKRPMNPSLASLAPIGSTSPSRKATRRRGRKPSGALRSAVGSRAAGASSWIAPPTTATTCRFCRRVIVLGSASR